MYVSSLILGILAWGFAVATIKSNKQLTAYRCSVISFGLCVTALFFQFVQIGNLAKIRDFSAIDDTIEGVIFGASVLIGVTIILNVIAIIRAMRR